MATWTNVTKNTSTYSNVAKNTASYTNQSKADASVAITAGESVGLLLALTYADAQSGSSITWTNQSKN